ncbi:MAG TPA: trypsin-like peptidase domain-containing protein, partial [Bacillota bacterium]|nr:trypsin-like peptidase domain-containing protein [Bacillota bacterium]
MDEYNHNQSPAKRSRKMNVLLYIAIGIVIGACIVVLAVSSMLKLDLLPEAWTPTEANDHPSENPINASDMGFPAENISVDVSTQITDIVEEVSPAVVGINNIQHTEEFWDREDDGQLYTGSGVIYKRSGDQAYVITNHHVVEGADELEVVMYDDTHVEATLLGSDLFSDLAVLQMDGKNIQKTIERGSSDNVNVGEPAITIGNPLGHMFAGSVTQGIISGKQRTIPQDFDQDGRADWQAEVIQTDAAINPGNSGGALISIEGQLIGINSMKINEEAVEGIGFAIPIDTAWPIIKELEQTGNVTRPFLGVEIYSLGEVPQAEWEDTLNLPDDVEGGVYVWSVEPLSPAAQAGVKRLDVITELDGKEVMNMIDLRKILYQEKKVGDTVKVTYYRDGKKDETTIKLGEQS